MQGRAHRWTRGPALLLHASAQGGVFTDTPPRPGSISVNAGNSRRALAAPASRELRHVAATAGWEQRGLRESPAPTAGAAHSQRGRVGEVASAWLAARRALGSTSPMLHLGGLRAHTALSAASTAPHTSCALRRCAVQTRGMLVAARQLAQRPAPVQALGGMPDDWGGDGASAGAAWCTAPDTPRNSALQPAIDRSHMKIHVEAN